MSAIDYEKLRINEENKTLDVANINAGISQQAMSTTTPEGQKKRGKGRPKKAENDKKKCKLTLLLTEAQSDRLTTYANASGVPKNFVILQALEEYLDRKKLERFER